MNRFFHALLRNQLFLTFLGAGVIALGFWLSRPAPAPVAPAPKGGVISVLPGGGAWIPVKSVRLPDSQALAFASDRQAGFCVAADGRRLVTADGGHTWSATPEPLFSEADPELVTAAGYLAAAPFVAVGVDQSSVTAIHAPDAAGDWKTAFEGQYGGLAGASADGTVLVGGGGLVVLRVGDAWTPRRIDHANRLTLYAAARDGARIVVVGEYGIVCESADAGQTWTQRQAGAAALYAVALVGQTVIVAGADGSFHRDAGQGFGPITGLDRGVTLTALASDGRLAVAGGQLASGAAVVFSSPDAGVTWHLESSAASGRLVGIAFGARGPFAAALTGELYLRQSLTY
jgi:photosystem II stability/assembly factor-like uncharacterized protein